MNIAHGCVRSGKSVAAMLAFLHFVASDIEGEMMVIGKSETALRRNVLQPFRHLLGSYMRYYAGRREINVSNRTIYFVGANDERAVGKIQGSTLAGALVDEISIIPEPVYKMLLSRLSVPGAKLFGTTNPDSPYHWLKRDFLDREAELDLKSWKFEFEDNPSLYPSYVENLKSEYQGLWYKRYVQGLWVLAEGAVYDFFDEKTHVIDMPPNRAQEYIVGIDYGTTNPCAFVLIGYNPETFPHLWLEKEYYYDSQKANRQKTDSEYAHDLVRFMDGYPVRAISVDPSAASFKQELRRDGISNIRDAENDVLNGIRLVTEYFYNGTFKVCKDCVNAIQEFTNYLWDVKAAERGIERPLKQHDHLMDAIRYALHTHYKRLDRTRMTEEDIDRMRREAYGEGPLLPPFFRGSGAWPVSTFG